MGSVVLIIVISLVFSGFFSAMETAFVTSNKLKLELDKKKYGPFGGIIDIFLRRPGQYIATILVGNNIALVVYSLNMSLLLHWLFSRWGMEAGNGSVITDTIISTVIIIFTAEFLPKAAARSNPNFFLRIFIVPVFVIYLILYPIAAFTTWLSILLLRCFGVKLGRERTLRLFDRLDLTALIEESGSTDNVNPEDNEMKIFRNALDFSDLRVRDCMVPRVDVEAVSVDDDIKDLTARFIDTNYSRIFVYDGTIDNIIGYVNTKSLFNRPRTVRSVLMDVDYVPESLSAQKLLTMFTKKKRAVAVVIDEFGGTAGMVSMEDILEEIFGEIEDEHDSDDMTEKSLGNNTFVFSCRLEVDYLNEKYNLGIPESDEYDTLAGYIIFYHEGIPAQGQTVIIDGKEIRILRKDGSKLELARVRVM